MEEGKGDTEIGTLIEHAGTANVQAEVAEIHAEQAIVHPGTTEIDTVIEHAGTANVQTEAAEIHADQAIFQGGVHHHHYAKPQPLHHHAKPKQNDNKHVKDFLRAVRENMLKNTKIKSGAQFKDLKQLDVEISPRMAVVEMTGKTEEKDSMKSAGKLSKKESDKVVGSDLHDISLQQLHNDHEGKSVKHVMILGDPGEGKSVSAQRYARLVSDSKVGALKDVELVHFIQVSKLQCETPSTAFDLLFSQQMGHGSLTKEMKLAGEEWLNENSSNILFVLDGLDQSREAFTGDSANIDSKTPAQANSILANVFTGHIYSGCYILTTARFHSFWNLSAEEKPHKTVALRGFDEARIKKIVPMLCGKEKGEEILKYLWSNAVDLRSLCSTPLFLCLISQVLMKNLTQSPDTLSGLMVSVLRFFFGSVHAKKTKLQNYMKLAFNGIKDNRFNFSSRYIRSLGLEIADLGDLLSSDADLDDCETEAVEEDLELFFHHQIVQEVLAALHVCDMAVEEFKQHLMDDLNKPGMEVVRKFTYAILLNEKTKKQARKYIPDAAKERGAMAFTYLKKLVNCDAVRDVKILLLMHECGSEVIKDLQPSIKRIHLSEEALKPSEMPVVIAVVDLCAPLLSVRVQNVELDTAILQSLSNALMKIKDFQAEEIIFGKQLQQSDCAALMDVVKKLRIISKITFQCCDEVMREFFQQLIEKKVDVEISTINIDDNKSLQTATISLLPDVFRVMRAVSLWMDKCDLTEEKLREFNDGIGERALKLKTLTINQNKTMPAEAYGILSQIVGKAHIEQLWMDNTDLTNEKLECFRRNIISGKTKIDLLGIDENKSMEKESYKVLAEIVAAAKVDQLYMRNCNLTTEKLQQLNENLTDVKLRVIVLDRSEACVSDEELFSCLCKLLPHVTELISVEGWMLSSDQQKNLQDLLSSPEHEGLNIDLGINEDGGYIFMERKPPLPQRPSPLMQRVRALPETSSQSLEHESSLNIPDTGKKGKKKQECIIA